MEFVVACGRGRGPPLERLEAHGAVVLHLVKGFSGGMGDDTRTQVWTEHKFLHEFNISEPLVINDHLLHQARGGPPSISATATRLGRVAVDTHSTLEPHKRAPVTRDDIQLLVLETIRAYHDTRGRVSVQSGAYFLAIRHVGSRAQGAEGARAEAQKLDGGGHCVCWATWMITLAHVAWTRQEFHTPDSAQGP